VRRALARAEQADLRLLLFPAGTKPDRATAALAGPDAILVESKADLVERQRPMVEPNAIAVSTVTGVGLDALRDRLLAEAEARMNAAGSPAITRARHRAALSECVSCLERASGAVTPELVVEDVRLAARALGRITGRVGVEDLLDVIFREFCIGK
jgi:tRNA modification GTPase